MPQKNSDSELILGLITTVGTEVDTVVSCLTDYLKQFNYVTEKIKVSNDILAKFCENSPSTSEYERIMYFMDLGNEVRKKTSDNAILMKGVAGLLSERRESANEQNGQIELKPRKRVAYIIESIKHPDEVEFLRDVYDDGFHLIGVTSNYDRRKNYLTRRKLMSEEEAIELLTRDNAEELGYDQHTQDAFQQADYFINIGNTRDEIQNSVSRLIDLIFGNPNITPSFEEYAMFIAYVSSLRSADLSRQVGAVIAKNNEVIASGTNDCPKAMGGVYWPVRNTSGEFIDTKHGRDYTLGYDSNKYEQIEIIKKIIKVFDLEESEENLNKIKSTGLGDITEYGRVVHAEMEALMMCARNSISCKDADMFVTTFPCHNCAKHIIAAGIKTVTYIEPYPKSKARDFYKIEITEDSSEKDKVLFTPFVGVGPHKFIDLFAIKSTRWYTKIRKDHHGKAIKWEWNQAKLRNPMPLFTYLESEKAAYLVFEDEIAALFKEEST